MRRLTGALALLAAASILAGCGAEGIPESSGASRGKDLFTGDGQCAGCHTLADAKTNSKVGPNLDDAFRPVRAEGFDDSTIRALVRNQIAYPVTDPVTGEPGMPANLVEGDDAEAVAAYVASVAGKTPEGQQGGTKATDGKSIFTSAGCTTCHTLSDAGSSGDIGPNLDQAKPSRELVIERVTNGKGQMPSFKDQLTDAQIKAVADYVSKAAGE